MPSLTGELKFGDGLGHVMVFESKSVDLQLRVSTGWRSENDGFGSGVASAGGLDGDGAPLGAVTKASIAGE